MIQKIVDSASLQSSDVVLEIGSGSGNMTLPILEQCSKVYAVDVDPKMANIVHQRVERYYIDWSPKLHCVISDILQMEIPKDIDHIISNVPYQISSELIFKLLASNHFESAILIFQEEFAQKLKSRCNSKQYSRLSVNAQMHCKIERILKIDRSDFQPPPHVDSAVVKLTPYSNEDNPWSISVDGSYGDWKHVSLLMNNYGKYTHSPEEDELLRQKKQHEYVQWNEFLKVCFSQKNKKLPSVFDSALRETRQRIIGENAAVVLRDLISGLGLNQSRANGTDIASFLRLFEQIRSRNFQFCPSK